MHLFSLLLPVFHTYYLCQSADTTWPYQWGIWL